MNLDEDYAGLDMPRAAIEEDEDLGRVLCVYANGNRLVMQHHQAVEFATEAREEMERVWRRERVRAKGHKRKGFKFLRAFYADLEEMAKSLGSEDDEAQEN